MRIEIWKKSKFVDIGGCSGCWGAAEVLCNQARVAPKQFIFYLLRSIVRKRANGNWEQYLFLWIMWAICGSNFDGSHEWKAKEDSTDSGRDSCWSGARRRATDAPFGKLNPHSTRAMQEKFSCRNSSRWTRRKPLVLIYGRAPIKAMISSSEWAPRVVPQPPWPLSAWHKQLAAAEGRNSDIDSRKFKEKTQLQTRKLSRSVFSSNRRVWQSTQDTKCCENDYKTGHRDLAWKFRFPTALRHWITAKSITC